MALTPAERKRRQRQREKAQAERERLRGGDSAADFFRTPFSGWAQDSVEMESLIEYTSLAGVELPPFDDERDPEECVLDRDAHGDGDLFGGANPKLIGLRRLKPLLQLVLSHNGRLASVSARTAFAADLGGDPGQGCETSYPVLENLRALGAQIVRQLARARDLAAVGPGLSDQFGLADIVLRTVA